MRIVKDLSKVSAATDMMMGYKSFCEQKKKPKEENNFKEIFDREMDKLRKQK